MPQLSILLSTRNHARWLDRCLDGICGQSFRDFEFQICDDGSTDGTPAMLAARAARDPRIRLTRHPDPLGVMASYAELVSQAAGEFLWMTASDDFVHDPDFLKRGFRGLQRNPELGGFFANSRRILGSTDEWDGHWGWWGWPRILRREHVLPEFLSGRLTIPGAACVMARTPFLELGGYRPEVGSLCDLLAALELGGQRGLWFTGTTSLTIRVFPVGQSHGTSADQKTQLRNWVRMEGCLRRSMPSLIPERRWLQWRARQLVECTGQSPRIAGKKEGKSEAIRVLDLYTSVCEEEGVHLSEENAWEFQSCLKKEIYPSWLKRLAGRFYRSLCKRMDRFLFGL